MPGAGRTQTVTVTYFGQRVAVLEVHATGDGVGYPPLGPSIWFAASAEQKAGSRLDFLVLIKSLGEEEPSEISIHARDRETANCLGAHGLLSFVDQHGHPRWGTPDCISVNANYVDGAIKDHAHLLARTLATRLTPKP